MNVSETLDAITQLQNDNPDKVGTVLALTQEYPSGILTTNNPLFGAFAAEYPIQITSLLTSSFSSYTNENIFSAYSSSYRSFITTNSITQYTNNLSTVGYNAIPNLFNVLKTEGGAVSSSLTVKNELILLKLDKNKINTLISCSLSDDEEVLSQGRLQFAKEMVSWMNDKIKQQNLFYYYTPTNIALNYSDDDSLDDSYAQLKTQNVYNYFNLNYENESKLVDEKLLPGVLHQILLYKDASSKQITGAFITPQRPNHFAIKQIFGSKLDSKFISNNSANPNIDFTYVPDINNDFGSNLYSNWKATTYLSGAYTHPNGYHLIDQARTKLNNTNLHIELGSSRFTNFVQETQTRLSDEIPYYAKVSFGIPRQEFNFIDTDLYRLLWDELGVKTVFGSLINSLYVNGTVLDESKLLINDSYSTSSVNINLLKFFNDYYNTSDITNSGSNECSDSPYQLKTNTKIGPSTNTVDEVYASLGYNSDFISFSYPLPIPKNNQSSFMEQFTNITNTDEYNFRKHLTPSLANSYYAAFLNKSYPTKSKFYFLTKIAKYLVQDDGSESFVQNFYFDLRNIVLNRTLSSDDMVYEFFDNQIHTNKRYVYKTTQLIIVPALAYGYTAADVVDIGTDMCLEVGISYIPTYKLIEVPIETKSDIVVLESPPVRPQIQFYPILNNRNKVLLQINPSGFDETTEPIIIEDLDIGIFDKVLESQNSTDLVSFSHVPEESGIEKYEIYRLTKYPSSYKDFSNNKIADINNVSDSSETYYDTVRTNVPYYYCVRSKNYRGLVSNPTNIYKITLVEDGEFFTLQQEIIENLNSENTYSRSTLKEVKRFLHISPSEIQRVSNISVEGTASEAISEFPLTTVSDQVWGKKFKVRVRSKSSGKTLDFNITFNKNNSGEYIPE
jgi:hypothetical protein